MACVGESEKEQRKKKWIATKWLSAFLCMQSAATSPSEQHLGGAGQRFPGLKEEQPFTTDLKKLLHSCKRGHLLKFIKGATPLNAGREFSAVVPV